MADAEYEAKVDAEREAMKEYSRQYEARLQCHSGPNCHGDSPNHPKNKGRKESPRFDCGEWI